MGLIGLIFFGIAMLCTFICICCLRISSRDMPKNEDYHEKEEK